MTLTKLRYNNHEFNDEQQPPKYILNRRTFNKNVLKHRYSESNDFHLYFLKLIVCIKLLKNFYSYNMPVLSNEKFFPLI